MKHQEVEQEIAIIKKMIEKTRKETAESGHFFIAIGIFSICCIFLIGVANFYHLIHLELPLLLIMMIGNGLIGYITVFRREKKKKVHSYLKTICYSIWAACAVPAIITFFLPYFGVIPGNLVGVFSTLIMGIAVFSTGVIFESKFIVWSSFVWWGGAMVMAFMKVIPQSFVMVAVIFVGWVMPGIILNRRYRNGSRTNESR
ncbi:hypothetical protein JW824_03545 [bacterium]|nr:hypothetical protein [bacterium]